MVTLRIDRKDYAFAAAVTVHELYRRAGVDPATHVICMELGRDYGPGTVYGGDNPKPLEDLAHRIRFRGKGGCPYRHFVSRPR